MSNRCDVLVVGAGPTGLTLAIDLRRRGVDVRLVDKLAQPPPWSKAAAMHARTMEIFDAMGVAGDLLPHCRRVHGINIHAAGQRVAHVSFDALDSRHPYVFGISQRDVELALASHLEQKQGGRVERPVTLTKLEQDEGGVTATLTGGGGASEQVRASYVVGCDGAHSTVRHAIGVSFEGSPYEERILQADVHVRWPSALDPDEVHAFLSPDGPLAAFPLFRDGRYRLIAVVSSVPEGEPTLDQFQALLAARGPAGAQASDPAWMVAFRIHRRMVDRYRVGRVLLAGDAAHIHSPVGGQGMNTGVQDAANLGWKLALALRGEAAGRVLDSYDAERRPVASATLQMTDLATRHGFRAMKLRHPLATGLRDQLLSFVSRIDPVRERLGQTVSMLRIGYHDSPVVAQHRPTILGVRLPLGEASEAPTLLDWAAFGEGPGPGERAPDAQLAEDDYLFDRIRSLRHALLLFDGAAATDAGYELLARVAAETTDAFGRQIDVHIVTPHATAPAALAGKGSVLLDAEGEVHRRYGARSECLYLVRPDGYIAYRSQPVEPDALRAYLKSIFVLSRLALSSSRGPRPGGASSWWPTSARHAPGSGGSSHRSASSTLGPGGATNRSTSIA
jgi:2-polyprenyl-6-methoxyphenol hydroxylase-like FAD-dependent oxidoreductase